MNLETLTAWIVLNGSWKQFFLAATSVTSTSGVIFYFLYKFTFYLLTYLLVLCRAELYYDRGNHQEFTSLVRELARPGEIAQNASYDFEFIQVEKPYESYTGTNVKLRYVVLTSVSNLLTFPSW